MIPFFAAGLSVMPGAGHLAVGRKRKAAALFAVDAGLAAALFFVRAPAGQFLIAFSYLMVMIPAVLETYALAHGESGGFSESKPYIVALLLVTGFAALPLLWQSPAFSRRHKIGWSLAVAVLAVLFFGFLGTYGIRLLHAFHSG